MFCKGLRKAGVSSPSEQRNLISAAPLLLLGRAGTPGMGWRKQSPIASASPAEWEHGMLRGKCLCYFNTNEFRNSVSANVLNSAHSVTSTPALTKQTQKPGLRKNPKALPSSSHRLAPSFTAAPSFSPWYAGIGSV